MNYINDICKLADRYERLTKKAAEEETVVGVPSPAWRPSPFGKTTPNFDKTLQSNAPDSNLKIQNIPGYEDFVQAIDFLRAAYGYLGRGNVELARPLVLQSSRHINMGMKEVFKATPEKELADDVGYSTR